MKDLKIFIPYWKINSNFYLSSEKGKNFNLTKTIENSQIDRCEVYKLLRFLEDLALVKRFSESSNFEIFTEELIHHLILKNGFNRNEMVPLEENSLYYCNMLKLKVGTGKEITILESLYAIVLNFIPIISYKSNEWKEKLSEKQEFISKIHRFTLFEMVNLDTSEEVHILSLESVKGDNLLEFLKNNPTKKEVLEELFTSIEEWKNIDIEKIWN